MEKAGFRVYPNQASNYIVLDCSFPLTKAAEWRLSDALGRVVKSQALAPNTERQSMLIENLANGIFFWKVQSDGEIIGSGKVIVIR
ncbi:MAG: T9SS type A sorting domain-containing protein [Phaeodactylibacter sp.]|nr:T9SS type A sorting domain-containing protein [Phaeodactylibacter sp.]